MPTRKVIKLDCIQLQHDTPETPLLPPNIVHNSSDISFDGRPRSTGYANRTDARDKYNLLRKEKSLLRSHRRSQQQRKEKHELGNNQSRLSKSELYFTFTTGLSYRQSLTVAVCFVMISPMIVYVI